ncbi:MAG TPA: DNA methyltransferase [Tepidisphaeraceae bacterium]|nr:DNA methyltransferase [Tepidisphaeraceae bacterium]
MKVMFCLFAEDVGLLPDKLFTKLINRCVFEPENFAPFCGELFEKMKKGGWYGNDRVDYFNGGLFDEAPPLPLNAGEIPILAKAATRPWHAVEPSIFGTLFERILDPKKRAQIGAHYTSKADILLVVEPVIMAPLRRKWAEVQEKIAPQLQLVAAEKDRRKRDFLAAPVRIAIDEMRKYLGEQRILDPACGSGNFLYVSLQQMLNLDDEIVRFVKRYDVDLNPLPYIRPTQLHGIEINPYAAELAQVVVWIGYLQWIAEHSITNDKRPILDKLVTIENRDAIVDLTKPNLPVPAQWPQADFIVGNPPFLGSKMFRKAGLSDDYLIALWTAHDLPRPSDLCCYWFDLARRSVEASRTTRAGLLATQGIRGGDNRTVLDRIALGASIFMAWSDREWVLDGAMVHVSIVGFDRRRELTRTLDGNSVAGINSDLTTGTPTTGAAQLPENARIAFMGTTKGGGFDLVPAVARELLADPNASGSSSTDVVKPWVNGGDVNGRPRGMFIIDFGTTADLEEASKYEAPLRYLERAVKPARVKNRRESYATLWWLHVEPRPALRSAISRLRRFGFTASVSKHRIFVWLMHPTLPDHAGFAFARDDDYFFGAVHSAIHELWARRTGTQLREAESGFRYTPSSCFETFPLPWSPGKEDLKHPAYLRIAKAAKALDEQRERWLNPPEWIDLLAVRIDAADTFEDVPKEARAMLRQSAIMAAAAKDPRLKKRTLTNLYNERPTWLKLAHEELDRAVLAAYAALDPAGGWAEDWAAVWVETGAGQPLPADHPLAGSRAEVDQKVLANLLRLNHARARALPRVERPGVAPRKIVS